ncbi:MAG: IS607 family transposase [Desulfurococcales archaeon]|nr:IS607 family transposase [Desulfurococcales archaeon]
MTEVPERLLTPSEVARIFGVTRAAVIKWIKTGKIRAVEIHGRWHIPYSEVERLLRGEALRPRRVAVYARVSGSTQRDDLERQLQALREWVRKTYGDIEVVEVTDIGSGINTRRRGLWKLMEMARRRQIDAVVVAYKDRLTRFGFEYLEGLFKAYGVKVVVAFQDEPKDYMQELVEDLVAIVTSFAARIYGRRSKKYKRVVKAVEEALKDP